MQCRFFFFNRVKHFKQFQSRQEKIHPLPFIARFFASIASTQIITTLLANFSAITRKLRNNRNEQRANRANRRATHCSPSCLSANDLDIPDVVSSRMDHYRDVRKQLRLSNTPCVNIVMHYQQPVVW